MKNDAMDLINMCFQIFKFISNVLSMISSMIMSSILLLDRLLSILCLNVSLNIFIAVLNNIRSQSSNPLDCFLSSMIMAAQIESKVEEIRTA